MYTVPSIPSLRVTVEQRDDVDAPVDDLLSDPEIEIHLASDNCVPEEDLVFLRGSDQTRETIQSEAIRSVPAEVLRERLGTREDIQGGSVNSVQVIQEEGPCTTAPGSVPESPEGAERIRIATHVQSILLATDGINQPHEALLNVVMWVQFILGLPFPSLPAVVPVQSEPIVEG